MKNLPIYSSIKNVFFVHKDFALVMQKNITLALSLTDLTVDIY